MSELIELSYSWWNKAVCRRWGEASSLSKGELENEAEKQQEKFLVALPLGMILWCLPPFFHECSIWPNQELLVGKWSFLSSFSPSSPAAFFSSRKHWLLPKKPQRETTGFFQPSAAFLWGEKNGADSSAASSQKILLKKWRWLYIHSKKWRLLYWAKAW